LDVPRPRTLGTDRVFVAADRSKIPDEKCGIEDYLISILVEDGGILVIF